MTSKTWVKCTRPGCARFGIKQYDVNQCDGCMAWMRGVFPEDGDAYIDETLLLRSRERLVGELKRVDERLAELALLKRK